MKYFIFLITTLIISTTTYAGTLLKFPLDHSKGHYYGHYVHLPDGYDQNRDLLPMIIVLHGVGENGDGSDAQLPRILNNVTPLSRSISGSLKINAIIVALQTSNSFENIVNMDKQMIQLFARFRVDKNRVTLTGLSAGGISAYQLGLNGYFKKYLAAIAPIAAFNRQGSTSTTICGAATVPVWAFHGDADTVVTFKGGKETIETLRKCVPAPVEAKFTVYPGVGHDSWTNAYNDPELYKWLLSKSLGGVVIPPVVDPVAAFGKLKVDFGVATIAAPAGYNKISQSMLASGEQLLATDTGKSSGVKLIVNDDFNGANEYGTSSPAASVMFDGTTTKDCFFGAALPFVGAAANPTAGFKLAGLSKLRSYKVTMFASRMSVSDNRETLVSLTGSAVQSGLMNASNNVSEVLVIDNVKASAVGELQFSLSAGSRNTNAYKFYYLNAFQIEEK